VLAIVVQGAAIVPRLTNLSDRVKCALCGTQMMLTRVVPDVSGNERGTFECPACEHVEEHVHPIGNAARLESPKWGRETPWNPR
jgi:uncharacterized protein (UPF0212 family)